MKIDKALLDYLAAYAYANPRLCQSYDLRTSTENSSQHMLNAVEPGTVIPIHRHRTTSETMVVIRGKLIERFFDNDGNMIDEFVMEPTGEHPMVQIGVGQWHSLEAIE